MAKELIVDEAPVEDESQRKDAKATDQELVRKVTEQVTAQLNEQFKSQLDGLNRRVSQEQKEKTELAAKLQERDEVTKTTEEQIAALRAEIREKERLASIREKKGGWKTEAVKHGLPDAVADAMDAALAYEDGVAVLERLAEAQAEAVNARISEKLATTKKPGAGVGNDATNGKKAEADMSLEELIVIEERRLQEATRINAAPPGQR